MVFNACLRRPCFISLIIGNLQTNLIRNSIFIYLLTRVLLLANSGRLNFDCCRTQTHSVRSHAKWLIMIMVIVQLTCKIEKEKRKKMKLVKQTTVILCYINSIWSKKVASYAKNLSPMLILNHSVWMRGEFRRMNDIINFKKRFTHLKQKKFVISQLKFTDL